MYEVALKFFVQTDAVVLPQSHKEEHLAANLATLSREFYDLTHGEMGSLGWSKDVLGG